MAFLRAAVGDARRHAPLVTRRSRRQAPITTPSEPRECHHLGNSISSSSESGVKCLGTKDVFRVHASAPSKWQEERFGGAEAPPTGRYNHPRQGGPGTPQRPRPQGRHPIRRLRLLSLRVVSGALVQIGSLMFCEPRAEAFLRREIQGRKGET